VATERSITEIAPFTRYTRNLASGLKYLIVDRKSERRNKAIFCENFENTIFMQKGPEIFLYPWTEVLSEALDEVVCLMLLSALTDLIFKKLD